MKCNESSLFTVCHPNKVHSIHLFSPQNPSPIIHKSNVTAFPSSMDPRKSILTCVEFWGFRLERRPWGHNTLSSFPLARFSLRLWTLKIKLCNITPFCGETITYLIELVFLITTILQIKAFFIRVETKFVCCFLSIWSIRNTIQKYLQLYVYKYSITMRSVIPL